MTAAVLPHQLYLRFLATRKEPHDFVVQQSRSRGYGALDRDVWREQLAKLGPFPTCWKSTLQPENVELFRWLRDLNVVHFWRDPTMPALRVSPAAARVLNLLLTMNLNDETGKDTHMQFEVIMPQARGVMTPEQVLFYRDLFWDLRDVDIYDEKVQEQLARGRPEIMHVFLGDPVAAFAHVGYFPALSADAVLNGIICFGAQQTALAARNGLITDGRQGAAIAAAQATLMRALELRKSFSAGSKKRLKQEATQFVLSQREISVPILHVDAVQATTTPPRTQEILDDITQAEAQRIRTLEPRVELISKHGEPAGVLEDP